SGRERPGCSGQERAPLLPSKGSRGEGDRRPGVRARPGPASARALADPDRGRSDRGAGAAVRARRGESGQASVELAAGAAVTLVVALLTLQLLAAGYAAVMADHAAEAGAIALANGRAPADAARSAVPGWPHGASRIQIEGNAVRV